MHHSTRPCLHNLTIDFLTHKSEVIAFKFDGNTADSYAPIVVENGVN